MLKRAVAGVGDLLHGLEELSPGIGRARLAAGGIEPPPVLQLQLVVEAEEIRRADRAVSTGDRLVGIKQVGEGELQFFGPAAHVVGGIRWVGFDIVAHDGGNPDAPCLQGPAIADQAVDDGLHIRAVIADEHDEQTFGAAQAGKGMLVSCGIG